MSDGEPGPSTDDDDDGDLQQAQALRDSERPAVATFIQKLFSRQMRAADAWTVCDEEGRGELTLHQLWTMVRQLSLDMLEEEVHMLFVSLDPRPTALTYPDGTLACDCTACTDGPGHLVITKRCWRRLCRIRGGNTRTRDRSTLLSDLRRLPDLLSDFRALPCPKPADLNDDPDLQQAAASLCERAERQGAGCDGDEEAAVGAVIDRQIDPGSRFHGDGEKLKMGGARNAVIGIRNLLNLRNERGLLHEHAEEEVVREVEEKGDDEDRATLRYIREGTASRSRKERDCQRGIPWRSN
jgi:hypothetical protein